MLAERLRRNDRRIGEEDHLVQPAGVRADAHTQVFGIGPPQRVAPAAHGECLLLPIHLARDAGLFRPVQVEAQIVKPFFRRNLPPETQGARPGHRRLHRGRLVVGQEAALRSVNAVMGHYRLARPGGVAAGAPHQPRRIHGLPKRHQHGQRPHGASHRTVHVGHHHPVNAGVRSLQVSQGKCGVGCARDVRAIALPLVTERLRAHGHREEIRLRA